MMKCYFIMKYQVVVNFHSQVCSCLKIYLCHLVLKNPELCVVSHLLLNPSPAPVTHPDELSPRLRLRYLASIKLLEAEDKTSNLQFKRSPAEIGCVCDCHPFMFTVILIALSITETPEDLDTKIISNVFFLQQLMQPFRKSCEALFCSIVYLNK